MTRRFLLFLLATAVLIGGATFFNAQSDAPAPETETDKPRIAATIFPVYDIARWIAGDAIDVSLVLPPGASPHTFEVSPSVILQAGNAEVIYAIGHGMDDWAVDVVGSPDRVVTVDKNIRQRPLEEGREHGHAGEGDEEEEHADGDIDPHYWLMLRNGNAIATTITDDLQRRFPEHREALERNFAAFRSELRRTEARLNTEILPKIENKDIITFHDAWYYFAKDNGLTIAGTYEPSGGREPTPQRIAELTRLVREAGTDVIYSEPQFGEAGLGSFAKDNGLTIAILDPIGGTAPREHYFDIILENAKVIASHQ